MEINLLDMGNTQYGDCIVITQNKKRILIDGAHAGDAESIKAQLKTILNEAPPYKFDLLIVTHCHSDHIGCLPRLVKENVLQFKVALVADEKLGFARDAAGDAPTDAVYTLAQKGLVTALMEEDYSNLPLQELGEFIADAASLESNYKFMLKQLTAAGTQVIRYVGEGTNGIAEIEAAFKDFGLKILGPTKEHLLLCTAALGNEADSNADGILKNVADDAGMESLANEYKNIVKKAADALPEEDMAGPGAAKNNQSIIIKLAADGWSALLAGDMQFAKAEVKGLNEVMAALLQTVNDAGPYDFIKLTHHTSYNGLNDALLAKWNKNTKLFAHTGGLSDPNHPEPKTLDLLKANSKTLTLARTDRNGIITVKKADGIVHIDKSKGSFNDFSVNTRTDAEPAANAQPQKPVQQQPAVVEKAAVPAKPVVETTRTQSDDMVEVTAKIPHTSTRVTITIDIDPEKKKPGSQDEITEVGPASMAIDKERFKNLLFVTCTTLLAKNIGAANCDSLISALKEIDTNNIVDIPANVPTAVEAARLVGPMIAANHKGIVIIGGYDVVPALQLDVLDNDTRQKLDAAGKLGNDADDFIVWNDDIYGDKDGDTLPELPVSRIPDGKTASLVMDAFKVPFFQAGNRFGLRNVARPFANTIYDIVPGNSNLMEVSAKFGPTDIQSASLSGAVYLMLHGSNNDGTKFWGETNRAGAYEAMNINNVPSSAPGTIVFTGCCWGALTVDSLAYDTRPRSALSARTPKQSIALTFLQNGALAFIGCTGSHYSPLSAPYNFYGKPLHDDFWTAIGNKLSPSQALLYAKQQYARNIPHGKNDLVSQAVERKILREFTCLGIGW